MQDPQGAVWSKILRVQCGSAHARSSGCSVVLTHVSSPATQCHHCTSAFLHPLADTLPTDVPHGTDDIRLSKLDDDGATAELVARVARVPVVVLCVAINQCIATATHAFNYTRAALHRRHVL